MSKNLTFSLKPFDLWDEKNNFEIIEMGIHHSDSPSMQSTQPGYPTSNDEDDLV